MRAIVRTAMAIAALFLPVSAPAQPPRSGLELVDYTDDFARIFDRDAALPDAEQAARFRAEFAKILPGFYDPDRVGVPVAEYDGFLIRAFEGYPEQRAGIQRVAREFSDMLAPAQRSFEAAFGPMTGFPPVYLVHSLGEFDGGTRRLPEGTRLMFGADMIDRIYQDVPVQPFFHHELFHLLHGRTFTDCAPIWCGLWTEGLAVHVAAILNPGASDAALLLTFPESLRAAVERDRPRAICAVVSRVDSTDRDDYRGLFSNGRTDPGLPGRFGYYVGYLVAQDLGRTRSLQQLAALKPREAEPLIKGSLAAMASCPEQAEASGERG